MNIGETFQTAMSSSKPFDALYDLAVNLKNTGMSQAEVYQIFNDQLIQHRNDKDESTYDVIADVMDFIVGFCNEHKRIFDTIMKT